MPSHSSAVSTKEVTGHSQLPISRIKKIIAQDSDINLCSSNATFLITIATEMFIQHMAEQAHNVVKSERKPRKNIQYRDLATAVARHDNLEFLSDIVPKTVTYKEFKEKKARAGTSGAAAGKANGTDGVERGQTTLKMAGVNGGKQNGGHGHHNVTDVDAMLDDEQEDDPSAQLELESRRVRPRVSEANQGDDGDVEMEE